MLYFFYTYIGFVSAGSFKKSELVHSDASADENRLVKAIRYFRGLKRDNMKRSAGNYQSNLFQLTRIVEL